MCLFCCVSFFALAVVFFNQPKAQKYGVSGAWSTTLAERMRALVSKFKPESEDRLVKIQDERIVYFRWDNSAGPTSSITKYVLDHFYTNGERSFGWKANNDSLALVPDPTDSGYVLRVFYKKGTRSSYASDGQPCPRIGPPEMRRCYRGAQILVMPPELYRRGKTFAALEYEVYFDTAFEFASGGKLPGLFGGISQCAGCLEERRECFTARLMWRAEGQGEVYAYVPYQQHGGWASWCEQYRDNNRIYCPNDTCGIEIGKTDTGGFRFIPGQWHKIREEVDVGHPNNYGRITLWVDGVIKVNLNQIVLRIKDSVGVDGLFFSTFYGGSLPYFGNHGDTYAFFRKFLITNERLPVPTEEYFAI